jgi:WD40 repeat protein/serine/threonine protein kinase
MSPDTDPRVPGASPEKERSSLDAVTPSSELVKRLSAHAPRETRYSIQGEVARGGMGAILRVWDEDLRRTLAMKVILGKENPASPGGTPPFDERSLGRFLEEAQVTGQLDHPGVVPVHELGLDATGRVYFTMRLVKGRDLKKIIDLVREGKEGWTVTKALSSIVKVCEAMAYAHSKGVIHRDLKPGNIMVGRFGETYVMDWGLARVVGREDRRDIRLQEPIHTSTVLTEQSRGRDDPDSPLLTMDGTVVGTPAYMSPEQARGEIEHVGVRSDVYSVGAMLYHLLTGRMPYVLPGVRASAHAVWRWVIEGPPRPVHALQPDVPAELVAICEKAMARDAEQRYADTMQIAEDILAYLEGHVVHAYETGAVAEFRKWVARNRGMAAASAAAIALAIGGLAGVGYVQARGKESAREGWAMAERKANEATESARIAKRQGYIANIVAADASLRSHEVAEAKRRLEACDEGLRGWEWQHLHLRADTSLAVLSGHEDGIDAIAVSPDGSRYASGSWDQTVRVWDAATGKTSMVLRGHDAPVRSVVFAPDGARLASAAWDGTARVWDLHDGKCLLVIDRRTGRDMESVAFSPDGSRIATTGEDSDVRISDARSGEPQLVLHGSEGSKFSIVFSPDGSRVAAASQFDSTVRIWDAKTGETRLLLLGHEKSVTSVAFSPDGSRLATSSGDRTIRIWNARSGSVEQVLKGHEDLVQCASFDSGGTRIASGSDDKTVRLWDLATGRNTVVLEGHEAEVRSVAFVPGGDRILSGSGDKTLRVWGVRQSGAVRGVHGFTGFLNSAAFNADGSRILSGESSQRAWLWDTWKEEPLFAFDGIDLGLNALALSLDGASIVEANRDNSIGVWDGHRGEQLRVLRGHQKPIHGLALSPDGAHIVSASMDGTVRTWDARSGESLLTLPGQESDVGAVAYSRDGSRIACAAKDHALQILDAQTGAVQLVLRGHEDKVQVVAFSPDDSILISGSRDRTARVWDAHDGRLQSVLRGHDGVVQAVAFFPDRSRYLSASMDGTVRVWDAQDGECLLVLRGGGRPVSAVAVSPDGARIAAASDDGTLRYFETSAGLIHDPNRSIHVLVQSLFDRFALAGDVVDHLRKDSSLGEDLRAAAIHIAELHSDDPDELNRMSWTVGRVPRAGPASCARAVRWSEIASSKRPDDGFLLNTLGIAQFRAGRFEKAAASLARSDQLNRGHPADVAFLAMAHRRLGHEPEAQAALDRLHALMQQPKWAVDTDCQAFAKEVETLFAGDAAKDAAGK